MENNKVLNDGLGYKPINLTAACLLFKSPWWAKVPEEAKFFLRRQEVDVNVYLDLTQAPPPEIVSRVGERCHQSTVVGFARKGIRWYYSHPKPLLYWPGMPKGRDKTAGPGPSRERRVGGWRPIWYLLFDKGMVQLVSNQTLNRWQALSREVWRQNHWPTAEDATQFIFDKSIHNKK